MSTPLSLRLKSLEDDDPWIIEQKTFDILNDYLQPDSRTSATAAAKDLDALTPMKREALGEKAEHPESFLLETWGTFIAIVKQIPSDHQSQDRMIQMMKELIVLPPNEVEIWKSMTRVWTDLPLLGAAVREAWIEPSPRDDTYEPFEHWVNFNAFAARLLESGLTKWWHFGVWSLRDALEEEKPRSKDLWEYRIRAAAQWIEQSCNILFRSLGTADLTERELNHMANGPLYKGRSGLSQERWKFWETKFSELAELEVSEEVKAIAIRAAKQMVEIEALDAEADGPPFRTRVLGENKNSFPPRPWALVGLKNSHFSVPVDSWGKATFPSTLLLQSRNWNSHSSLEDPEMTAVYCTLMLSYVESAVSCSNNELSRVTDMRTSRVPHSAENVTVLSLPYLFQMFSQYFPLAAGPAGSTSIINGVGDLVNSSYTELYIDDPTFPFRLKGVANLSKQS